MFQMSQGDSIDVAYLRIPIFQDQLVLSIDSLLSGLFKKIVIYVPQIIKAFAPRAPFARPMSPSSRQAEHTGGDADFVEPE
jgi:hypothetical protein